MKNYRVTPAADTDLDRQADYLMRESSLDTALRFYAAASATFEAIVATPGIGEIRPTKQSRLAGLRTWRVEGFEKHLVFYRKINDGIEIVRVLHGSRDIGRLFADDREF